MAALSRKLRSLEGGGIAFFCPGCREMHQIHVGAGPGPRWTYNGNADAPTFAPSILVRGNKLVRDEKGDWTGEWERDANGNLIPQVCHSFVVDGAIQFLSDSTHAFAGQTVPLPDLT